MSLVAVFGCSVDNYTFVPDSSGVAPPDGGMEEDAGDAEPPPPPPPSAPTACTSDDECAELAATVVCDTEAGYCVECDPAREADLRLCPEGTYCAAGGQCVVGCQSDTDCRAITCDPERGLCINCTGDSDCAQGTACVDGVCSPSCSDNDTCPYGWLCCDGACQNPETDPTACGACGNACDSAGACWNGVCGEGPCEPGTAECDGDASNGCETVTTDDPNNCGKCRLACASSFCAGGQCTTMACQPGTADCNGDESDHCETDLTDVNNCQMCRTKCSDNHGTPSCGKHGCEISCDDGYDDCDGDVSNGCEINLQDDLDHCGDCDTACTNDHGTTSCKDGECTPKCAQGFADCDGDPSNGCEADIDGSLANCGACGAHCMPDNATGTCDAGVCKVKCHDGFEDCDGSAKNGCEADLSSAETCGSCDNRCSDAGGKATCADPATQKCAIKCDANHADCVNGATDGCETDITVSAGNCGACGNVCPSTLGTPVCRDSTCGISNCTAPLEDCIATDKKECETDTSTDASNCGGCGTSCNYKNGVGVCTAGACALDHCASGYADCNAVATDGCETALGTTSNCRKCGESCTNEHGTNECTSSGCSPVCANGWGDCDGNKNNGCETPLNTLTDCGACGASCTKQHGTPTCASGSCQIDHCNTGWDDCSANENTAKDGCETQLNTLSNCNGCGVTCSLANGTASCGTGQCVLTGCNGGFADCTSQAGCETQLGTTNNCGACGDKCSNSHGATTCSGTPPNAVCTPSCSTGYKSCDGNPSNGCETNVRTLSNCGDCGASCSLPNATASCSTGTCSVQACSAGYLDCTSAAGCETPSGTLSNCRSCGEACTNAHGGSTCDTTTGCGFTCSGSDWADCDLDPKNGCETSLTSLTDCGKCGTACEISGSSASCSTGSCVPTTCATGFDDCDGNGSCETELNTVNHCNGCNHVCTAQNGTTDCTGSAGAYVCTPTCNAGYKSCDGDPDNGCERSIRTVTDCGDCGVACSFQHASASCSTGTCTMGTCDAGFANCDNGAANGCEVQLGTVSNCAACGNACTNAHGTNGCTGSPGSYDCAPMCESGYLSCDGNPDNGCETPTNTSTDCGGCGVPCSLPHGTASCTTGTCTLTGCSTGYADCNASPGCETATNTVSNCGGCNIACTNPNGTTSCTGTPGVCTPVCATGYKSCDADPNNGCERNIRTVTDCGDCNAPCSFSHASASCSTGTCTFGTCDFGYASCDGTTANGCETPLGTATNCSACGDVCSNSHGTTSCSSTNKVCVPVCSSGYGDCNGNPSDGCEADLSSAAACGACGNVCSGATPACVAVNGTYKCQAVISYLSDTDGQTNQSNASTTLDVSHNLLSGTNRLLLAAIVTEGINYAGVDNAKPTSVSFGPSGSQVAMTFFAQQSSDSGAADFDNPYIYYYYLTDTGSVKLAGTGTQSLHVGTGTVVVSGQTKPAVAMIVTNLLLLEGVDQTTPLVVGTGGRLANAGSTCSMVGSVNTTVFGSALYVMTAAQYSGSVTKVGSFTTSYQNDNLHDSERAYGGYLVSSTQTTGAHTLGYSYQWCSPAIDLPLAIVPYRQP